MKHMKQLPQLPARTRYLSDEERERLLRECQQSRNPLLYEIVTLALSTGMRRSEILNLRWRDIDLKNNHVMIRLSKNGQSRTVPLVGLAHSLLLEHYTSLDEPRGTVLLFLRSSNPNKPISIREAFEHAVKRAGIEDFTFHDLRHSSGSYMAMTGASMLDIATILGHKSLAMTRRYTHLSNHHIATTVARMNQAIFG